jgi:hypothetical protein
VGPGVAVHHAAPAASHGPARYRSFAKYLLNQGFSDPMDRKCVAPEGQDRARELRGPQLSSLICASRITGPHFPVSDCRKAANSFGVEPLGSAPSSSKRDFTAG